MSFYFYLLRYGSKKTRILLSGILLLFAAAVTGFIWGIVLRNFLLGASCFMLFIFCFVLIASISFETIEKKAGKKKGEAEEEKRKEAAKGNEGQKEENGEEGQQKQEDEKKSYLEEYDAKKIKKLLSKKGGGKKEHRTVMIDSWEKENIRQSPAYIWREKGKLVFLVLEKEARLISVPGDSLKKVYYEKGAAADINQDYQAYSGASLISVVFAPYLPGYYERVQNGHTRYCKNLYVLGAGIKLTNTSARGLFEIIGLDFPMEDEVSRSRKFDRNFVKAYHYQLLLRDNALTMEEYQGKLKELLTQMSHSSMEFQELVDSLKKMLEYKLVMQEPANQCLEDFRAIQYEKGRKKK